MSTHDNRIHAFLDGELPREALTADEVQRLHAMETALAETSAVLRRSHAPDLTARVMAGLPASEALAPAAAAASSPAGGVFGRLGRWILSPLTITFRPVYALAGGLALVALLLLPPVSPTPVAGPALAGDAETDTRLYVQFRIEVPNATQVALAGSFTSWQPDHELSEVSPGVWSTMVPLEPGVHDYTFVIDGETMIVDPYAPRVADSFGGSNSRLFLPAPNERV